MSAGPIFVAGLERTGTSLMYALLASHDNIAMTRRTNFWTYFADQYGDLSVVANLDACLDTMSKYKRIVALDPDFHRLRKDFLDGESTYGRLFSLLEEQVAERLGRPRWGDKSLNTERYADRLLYEYPDARVLHMIRDPRDRYASVITRWKHRKGGVGAGTAAWLWSAGLASRNARVYPDSYLPVRYESLVEDPVAELQRICVFIGEQYSDTMLNMDGAAQFRDDGANSSYGVRRGGTISTDSIGRHQTVLTTEERAFIQLTAGRRMKEYGYEKLPIEMDMRQRVKFWSKTHPYNTAVATTWRTREVIRNVRGRRLPNYRLVGEAV